jgi:hypothetical protein
VRHTLLYNYMASPDAAEEAFHLWNAVESPNCQRGSAGEGTSAPPAAPAAISVDVGPTEPPPNVVIPAAPVPPLIRIPPTRIQVANVAYCDAHGWTVVVQVPVVLCSLPLDKSSPPTNGLVPASLAREPVTPRASSPVAGHRRDRSLSSPPSGPPRSAPRVNGPATAAAHLLATATLRGPSWLAGACPRYASSPETPATPSSSRHCRPCRHHLHLRYRSAPRSAGRGSTSRMARPLLRRRASHTLSFARAEALALGFRAAGASASKVGTTLLLPRRGVTPLLLELHRCG